MGLVTEVITGIDDKVRLNFALGYISYSFLKGHLNKIGIPEKHNNGIMYNREARIRSLADTCNYYVQLHSRANLRPFYP